MIRDFMLDTNTASQFMRGRLPALTRRMTEEEDNVCISIITKAEILNGVALRPEAHRLGEMVDLFLADTYIAEWSHPEATVYGKLRAHLQRNGIGFGLLDLMIAAHALAAGCTLVTADKAFAMVPNLKTVNWEA
jgi:tRNA(fMet)-specific endonuclease VapC